MSNTQIKPSFNNITGDNDNSTHVNLNKMLDRAMVKYASNPAYDFKKEQDMCHKDTRLPANYSFRDYFVKVFSGQYPPPKNSSLAEYFEETSPLNDDGSFKAGDYRFNTIRKIIELNMATPEQKIIFTAFLNVPKTHKL